MKNIMLVAAPAAGKGTQADLLVEKYNIPHISTGDILRDMSKMDNELGIYVRETLSSGKLVKDDITFQLIEERLKQKDCQDGFVIDGFPRNLQQALHYDKILENIGQQIGIVIYIDLPKEILEKRITGRRICEDCKAIYNINDKNSSPQIESTCDLCGGILYQRSDDNIEAFETRYNMYLEQTKPIVKHYEDLKLLKHVDGNGTVQEVFERINKVIGDEN